MKLSDVSCGRQVCEPLIKGVVILVAGPIFEQVEMVTSAGEIKKELWYFYVSSLSRVFGS